LALPHKQTLAALQKIGKVGSLPTFAALAQQIGTRVGGQERKSLEKRSRYATAGYSRFE
jgi:hypothetical protein